MTVEGLGRPRRLERTDVRTSFHSGVPELDEWLHRFAYQNQSSDSSAAYVSCIGNQVVAFYTIAAGAVSRTAIPTPAGDLSDEIPCILLARLAVDFRFTSQGIGSAMLEDALRRALHVSTSIGAQAVLAHAGDPRSRRFYQHNVDCFPSPVDDLQLVIPMAYVAQVYRTSRV